MGRVAVMCVRCDRRILSRVQVDKDAKRARTSCQRILQQVAVQRSAAAGVGGEVARGGRGSETHPGRCVNVDCRKSVFCLLLLYLCSLVYLLYICVAGGVV